MPYIQEYKSHVCDLSKLCVFSLASAEKKRSPQVTICLDVEREILAVTVVFLTHSLSIFIHPVCGVTLMWTGVLLRMMIHRKTIQVSGWGYYIVEVLRAGAE